MAEPLLADLGDAERTPNEILRDRTIRRAAYREAYKEHLIARLVGDLNTRGFPRIESRIESGLRSVRERGYTTTPYTHKALAAMLLATDRLTDRALDDCEEELTRELDELVEEEHDHTIGLFALAFPALTLATANREQLAAVVRKRPFQGRTLSEWFQRIKTSQKADLRQAVQTGIAGGERAEEIVQRVRGSWLARYEDGVQGRTRRWVDLAIRGGVTGVAAQAKGLLAGLNREAIVLEQWIATLDAATCLDCAGEHGNVFKLGQGLRPPLHERCRCEMMPIGPGEPPARLSFDDWLRGEPVAVQNDILGVRRAQLYRTGKIGVKDFRNRVGRRYTLKQLRALEPDVFEAAGL